MIIGGQIGTPVQDRLTYVLGISRVAYDTGESLVAKGWQLGELLKPGMTGKRTNRAQINYGATDGGEIPSPVDLPSIGSRTTF